MSRIEDRLAQLGISIPAPNAPVANYVPFVRVGDMVHVSGQVSKDADGGVTGVVGEYVWRELGGQLQLTAQRPEVDVGRGDAMSGHGPFLPDRARSRARRRSPLREP